MRWLTEFVVKSSLRLAPGQTDLTYDGTGYQIHLRDVENATHDEALIVKVVFDAEDDRQSAEEASDQIIERFLDLLTVSTNVGARVERRTFLLTWEVGFVARRQFSYAHHTVDDAVDILDVKILSAVSKLEAMQPSAKRPQAFHWFNAALRTNVFLDQFQLFWFVVETLSNDLPMDKTHKDKCECGGVFHCDGPEHHPSKRGSGKLRIEQVMADGGLDPRLVAGLSKVRNYILHGLDLPAIEAKMRAKNSSFSMESAVQIIADQAWQALIRTVTSGEDDIPDGMVAYPPTRMMRVTGAAELGLGPCEGGSPEFFDKFPVGTVSFVVTDAQA